MKRKPSVYTVYKCVQDDQEHDKTEYGKDFEIALYNIVAYVPERIDVNFFYKR